jgi:hypothetical protein
VLGGLALPVSAAFAADGPESGGVAAALGSEVTAEADHVDPAAQSVVGGVFAELPGDTDQLFHVVGTSSSGSASGVMRRSPRPKSSALLVMYLAM